MGNREPEDMACSRDGIEMVSEFTRLRVAIYAMYDGVGVHCTVRDWWSKKMGDFERGMS